MKWADAARRLGVYANADTPRDAAQAKSFGAEGIGLCRTEHMFFEGDRIKAVREMIVAKDVEARKTALATKQELVERAYALALEKLCALPEKEYTEVLAKLLVQASSTGREEVVFSSQDRERIGKAAVARANEMLAAAAAPDLPSASGKVGEILGKVVAGVSAIAQGTAMLSLSEETRPMRGGFILKDQNVEVNCTFETLVRLQRAETAGAVAKKLFG